MIVVSKKKKKKGRKIKDLIIIFSKSLSMATI